MTALTSDQIAQFTPAVTRDTTTAGVRHPRPLLSNAALIAADGIAALLAAHLAHRTGAPRPTSAVLFVLIAYLAVKGRYTARLPALDDARRLVSATALCLLLAFVQVVPAGDVSAGVSTGIAACLFCAFATIGNLAVKRGLRRLRLWQVPVAIIGDGGTATEAEAALRSQRSLGYDVVGRIAPGLIERRGAGHQALRPLMDQLAAARLLIAVEDGAERQRLIDVALVEGIDFSVVSAAGAHPSFRSRPTSFFGRDITMHCVDDGLARRMARSGKTLCDLLGAALLVVAISPIFAVLIALSRLDGGPAFFSQPRIGAGGRPFRCLKFRTMVVDAESRLTRLLEEDQALASEWHATRKLKNDPRVTRVGRFLRKTSLDELPQLFNVLRGEMSLIGPRPIAESEMPLYGADISHYLVAKPGLTGIWQVSGRSNTSYEHRVQLDAWYVRNWTFWNDVAILARTIPAVLRRDGAR